VVRKVNSRWRLVGWERSMPLPRREGHPHRREFILTFSCARGSEQCKKTENVPPHASRTAS
jgi:hypothetical protein